MDSRPIPSGCGAVLGGHTWVMFRGRAPSRQHSSFGPTLLSCALSNSVSNCEKGRLAGQILGKISCTSEFKGMLLFMLRVANNKIGLGDFQYELKLQDLYECF